MEPEVESWLRSLASKEQAKVAFYFDLLAEKGVLLEFPYTSQLRGKLRELRFHLGRGQQRVTYYLAPGRRIPMLTVFRKSKRHETAEIDRAEAAMKAHMERDQKGRR